MKRAYEEYLRVWKDKDLTALNHLLSDDYLAVNFQGIISTKANEIAIAKQDRTYNALSGDVLSVALLVRGPGGRKAAGYSVVDRKMTYRQSAYLQVPSCPTIHEAGSLPNDTSAALCAGVPRCL